ncbi:MAG: hypothetical protein ACR2HI_07415 [Gaiella sp.]
MALVDDLERIAGAAEPGKATPGAILAAEAASGFRAYVCAFVEPDGATSWVVLDATGSPVRDRRDARDAVAIAALCELAEEAAFPGELDELRAQLVALRIAEAPEGIEEAEAAALALQRVLASPPQLATPARLDAIGSAAQRLERALDPSVPSPFSAVMRFAQAVVDELWADVERTYRGGLAC